MILPPIRCFTCNKIIGDCWNKYYSIIEEELKKEQQNKQESEKILDYKYLELTKTKDLETPQKKALDQLLMNRYCCRRMFLSQPPFK